MGEGVGCEGGEGGGLVCGRERGLGKECGRFGGDAKGEGGGGATRLALMLFTRQVYSNW